MEMQEQPPIVENPFWARIDRRINTYGAAMSDRRGVANLRFVDFTKMPFDPWQSRRYAIYGDVLAAFLIIQEWSPDVKSFGMGEGKHPVTESDPAVDSSAVVVSKLTTGESLWTTCIDELPTTDAGKKRLAARERKAKAEGCRHQVFTYDDGIANAQLIENSVFLNPLLQRVADGRFDCRYEISVIHDALKRQELTTLEYLQSAEDVSVFRMQGTVARLLHSGDLAPVRAFARERFSMISELRWTNRVPTFGR
jgi:hypothetical protein